uniref:G_PROTEIN_RECEP_F1_2 domain-containing protein n=1 Tax=Parastrongyloides trichosuri TaxID=131310 RepID=A0A0N4ZCN8_PARTI
MPIAYVLFQDTIADIAIQRNNSSNLNSILSFLLAILIIISFSLNILIFASIYSNVCLRNKLLYLLLSNVVFINLLDILTVIFVSLLHIANSGQWIFGDAMCKANVFFQQFVLLASILSILLMCVERAIGKNSILRNVMKKSNVFFALFGVYIISVMCCIPLFLKRFVTSPDRYHFQCLLNSQAPIGYTFFMIFLYIIITVIIGIGLILIRIQKHIHRSLPNSQEEYGRFINETREIHEYTNLTKLTVFLLIAYSIFQLPYIVMVFFNRFKEMTIYESTIPSIAVYSDFETLITFMRFMFPFISALIISFRCSDIWIKVVNLIFCRRNGPITINQWSNNTLNATPNFNAPTLFSGNRDNNVIRLVATNNGMELRIPKDVVENSPIYITPPPSYIETKNEEQRNISVNACETNNVEDNMTEIINISSSRSNISDIISLSNEVESTPKKLQSRIPKSRIKKASRKDRDKRNKNLKTSNKIVVKGQFIRKKQQRINPSAENE